MEQAVKRRNTTTEQPRRQHQQEEIDPTHHTGINSNNNNQFIQCADLVLPWLTHKELANASSTCKILRKITQSITRRRSLDASRSLETRPIPFHDPLNHRPYAFFLYAPSQFVSSRSYSSPSRQPWGGEPYSIHSPGRLGAGGESGTCACLCPDGDNEAGMMLECGFGCSRGISVKLKVVWDGRKGWGLCADQLIPKRHFVCEYAGELLTTEEARRRQEIYDDLSSSGQFASALLVVREHLPSGKACLRINIDATRIGNVARFINHSCDGGNLSTVLVRSSGSLLPRLCFFASKDIKEGEELTFSYGEIRVRSKGLLCFCGSSCCFGTLPSEHT